MKIDAETHQMRYCEEQSEECAFSGRANLLAWRGKDRQILGNARGKTKNCNKLLQFFVCFFNLVGKTSFPEKVSMGAGADKPYQFDSFFFVVNHQPIGSDVTFPCAFIFAG